MNIVDLITSTETQTRNRIIRALTHNGVPYRIEKQYIVTTFPGVRPLICVHTDTVSKKAPLPSELRYSKGILSLHKGAKVTCLGADDRAGIWIALKMIKDGTATPFNYAFFKGEEQGCMGSCAFAEIEDLDAYQCFISLDRACRKGVLNVATYGYDSADLTALFTAYGYQEQHGSFTDCSTLSGACTAACCNLSVGYDFEHSVNEILDTNQMQTTLNTMRAVMIPEDVTYEAVEVPVYSQGYYWGDDLPTLNIEHPSPVLCDMCGEHARLYEHNAGYLVCADCLDMIAE